MGTRKNTFNQIGYSSAGIARMPTGLKEAAIEHETNRQHVVASILLELVFMSLIGAFDSVNHLLTLKKAVSQSLAGNKEDATQAAHCVPRQVYFGTETMQEILHKIFPERAWAVSVMFGDTDILPVDFNKCDSLAEKKGLETAFLKACQHAVDNIGDIKFEMNSISMRAESAFTIYKDVAAVAYLESLTHLKGKFKPILFEKVLNELTRQLQIMEQYADTLNKLTGKEKAVSLSKIEGLMRIYEKPY